MAETDIYTEEATQCGKTMHPKMHREARNAHNIRTEADRSRRAPLRRNYLQPTSTSLRQRKKEVRFEEWPQRLALLPQSVFEVFPMLLSPIGREVGSMCIGAPNSQDYNYQKLQSEQRQKRADYSTKIK